MIKIEIPGREAINAEHLVLDYNGTLAEDGIIIPNVKFELNLLAKSIKIHVITADTFGIAQSNLKDVNCKCTVISKEEQELRKQEFVSKLGANRLIAIGNGYNDNLMVKDAALGIIVIQKEGASVKTLINANIICNNIFDAFGLLKNPLRITATLRN